MTFNDVTTMGAVELQEAEVIGPTGQGIQTAEVVNPEECHQTYHMRRPPTKEEQILSPGRPAIQVVY